MSEDSSKLIQGENEIEADPPAPEPIYDFTTLDKTELLKAAGPIERGEEP